MGAASDKTYDLADLERRIRVHSEAGENKLAATLAIECYGAELLRFISAMLRDEVTSSDVFGEACEDIWCGIPQMRWHSSFRTWCYSVARNACYRHLRSQAHRRSVPLSEVAEIDRLTASVRAATQPYLRTEVKDAFVRLREALSPEEQELLTLRIDRDLDWNEITQILADEPLDSASRKRAAATCRKRFERLTDKLRELAIREGLIDQG